MRRFADWAITKDWIYIDEEYPEDEFYIERGCPKYALLQYLTEGWRIFEVDGKVTKKLRDELGWEKTDENDVKLIKLVFEQNPEKFVELLESDRGDLIVKQTMTRYEKLNRMNVSLKNQHKAFIRECGEIARYESVISSMEKLLDEEKKLAMKQVKPLLQDEYACLEDIKGVGPVLTARLMAAAHPKRFSSRSAYINYCGYTAERRESNKYSRVAKSILFLIAECTMKSRDEMYRSIYDSVKEKELEKTCASCYLTKKEWDCKRKKSEDQKICGGRAHSVALNRVATKLAKDIFTRIKTMDTADKIYNYA